MLGKGNKMEIRQKKMFCRVVFDVLCIGCIGVPVLVLFLLHKPYQRGFYCDDESLMHPYKTNTIPTWVAGFIGILLPSLAILIIEGIKSHRAEDSINYYVARCYRLFIPFLFGAGLSQLTTDIGKYTIGRLRPHFLTVCQPNITVCAINTGFISPDTCTGTDLDAIQEARVSFPSGHSSISFYCMIWLMVYLQYKFTWKRFWLLRPILQSIAFFLAYACALSRISDYMHHWSDVMAGGIIGLVIAVLNIFFMSNILPWRKQKCEDCSTSLPLYGRNNNPVTTSSSLGEASPRDI